MQLPTIVRDRLHGLYHPCAERSGLATHLSASTILSAGVYYKGPKAAREVENRLFWYYPPCPLRPP